MKIPLAEHFHSIQGEGHWVGTPMHFIRLPGCNVGQLQYASKGDSSRSPTLPSGKPAWKCRTWNGTEFWCDTDFNKYSEVDSADLLAETWENHICITGGEPTNHLHVIDFFVQNWARGNMNRLVHLETSGTKAFVKYPQLWVTVSPKQNCFPEAVLDADELKLLITSTTEDRFPTEFNEVPLVFLSPINGPGTVQGDINNPVFSKGALTRCHELLQTHPDWRLSVQLHKYLGVR